MIIIMIENLQNQYLSSHHSPGGGMMQKCDIYLFIFI